MRRDELMTLYAEQWEPAIRARALRHSELAGLPMLVGILAHHTTLEVAAVVLELVRWRSRKRAHAVAVTVVDGCVYLERPSLAKPESIAMVADYRASLWALAESLVECQRVAA